MKRHLPFVALAAALLALNPRPAFSHCDTLDGPVVKDARTALETRDVSPVLKWVPSEKEGEIRQAFADAVAVRRLTPEARSLADRFFFETVVRVHRQGEGAPYTGLQPVGTEVEPGIAASDRALESGSVEALVTLVSHEVEEGIRKRFMRVQEMKEGAGKSVGRGREYVAAYVAFIHYAEGVMDAAAGPTGHAEHKVEGPEHVH